MECVKGSCGIPHPVLQCWVGRVGWGLLGLGGVDAHSCAASRSPPSLWGDASEEPRLSREQAEDHKQNSKSRGLN